MPGLPVRLHVLRGRQLALDASSGDRCAHSPVCSSFSFWYVHDSYNELSLALSLWENLRDQKPPESLPGVLSPWKYPFSPRGLHPPGESPRLHLQPQECTDTSTHWSLHSPGRWLSHHTVMGQVSQPGFGETQ